MALDPIIQTHDLFQNMKKIYISPEQKIENVTFSHVRKGWIKHCFHKVIF